MKKEWLITFRSITFAQKAQWALGRRKIQSTLRRTPKALTERGCGYCLGIAEKDISFAMTVLQREKLTYEKLYTVGENGEMEERAL